jgi:hypothetical protein
MLGLISYTFVTMVGGNPHHDAYGFRYWNEPVCHPIFWLHFSPAFFLVLMIDIRGRLSSILCPPILADFWDCCLV